MLSTIAIALVISGLVVVLVAYKKRTQKHPEHSRRQEDQPCAGTPITNWNKAERAQELEEYFRTFNCRRPSPEEEGDYKPK